MKYSARMIDRDADKQWAHCNVQIINCPKPKVDYTQGL